MIRIIVKRDDLVEVARELGVRRDWHEPDEQEVTAKVFGTEFDNAGFWGPDRGNAYFRYQDREEMHVVLFKDGTPVAAANLATVLAWATNPDLA